MADSFKLTEMQRNNIEFQRQRHLANWLIKSSPHMATPSSSTKTVNTTATTTSDSMGAQQIYTATALNAQNSGATPTTVTTTRIACNGTNGVGHLGHGVEARNPKLRRFNSHDTCSNMFSVADFENARLARRNEVELKQRLARRLRNGVKSNYGMDSASFSGNGYNSSVVTGGINSIANGYGGGFCNAVNSTAGGDYSTGDSKVSKYNNESQTEPLPAEIFLDRFQLPRVVRISYKTQFSDETLQSSSSNDSSIVTSSSSASIGTQSALHNSSNGYTHSSETATSSSTVSSTACVQGKLNSINSNNIIPKNHNNNSSSRSTIIGSGTNCSSGSTSSASSHKQLQSASTAMNLNAASHAYYQQSNGELFLLYRLIRQRHVYHGHNAKNAANSRKKGILIPQEFPGYFSLMNDKGLPTATQYISLIQLVRERVYKFISVDNMPAFTESQPNTNSPPNEGCLPIYTTQPPNSNRPHYIKTTARGGQVFRLLAVFEDGKQDNNAIAGNLGGGIVGAGAGVCSSGSGKSNSHHGREKEKGRYAQLLNENRQVLYVSLSTKGKFYEIEPGIPQILQKLGGMQKDAHKKVNSECVHRINMLVTPNRVLPLRLRYISGPNSCANAIFENICITKITTENIIIACPIEGVEVQSPLHLRKLHLTKEMMLIKSCIGFESEQRMLANPNMQNILKYCQFNCDQFLKLVEIKVLNRTDRSGSKSRVDGLKLLKPLHLPKLLRREKTVIPAHEKEDSIIFLSKTDLANMEAKETAISSMATSSSVMPNEHQHLHSNRITEKMKVFQSTKKKWFKKQDKPSVNSLTALELDMQAKRMSMERYTDMSKLLQERFGDKPNITEERESISEPSSASDNDGSDTETTTLATIEQKFPKSNKSLDLMLQKSMSLQDIELMSCQCKPDLFSPNNTTADTISEAGTELDDLENQAPTQSFITEKLYNEFHVKTRQYSKSSSSLHQLMNFSLPQKLQLHEHECERERLNLAQSKQQLTNKASEKCAEHSNGDPISGRRAAGGLSLLSGGFQQQASLLQSPVASLIEDDLPYSNVRDSLLLSSDDSPIDENDGNICQALNMIEYTKENIYAEICQETSGLGVIPTLAAHKTSYSDDTHSRQVANRSTVCSASGEDDDYGDYASLCYPQALAASSSGAAHIGNGVSRVQINCSSSPISYHTVYFGEEPLGERYAEHRRSARENHRKKDCEREHVTTLELAFSGGIGGTAVAGATENADIQSVDNIYNTLK